MPASLPNLAEVIKTSLEFLYPKCLFLHKETVFSIILGAYDSPPPTKIASGRKILHRISRSSARS